MSSKPPDVCWCDCHEPVSDTGQRIWLNQWPRYDDPVALAVSCDRCVTIHTAFQQGGAIAAANELHRLASQP